MAVQIDAVDAHFLRVGGRLARVFDDLAERVTRKTHAGQLGNVEIGVERGGVRELHLVDETGRGADPSETGRELDEQLGAVDMAALRELPPAREIGARSVNAREHREIFRFRGRVVDVVADRDEAGRNQAAATLGARGEILHHLLVRPAGLLTHHEVAHRRHDKAVLDRHPVDADGAERRGVGVQLFRKARGAARFVFAVSLHPASVTVDKLLDFCVGFHA